MQASANTWQDINTSFFTVNPVEYTGAPGQGFALDPKLLDSIEQLVDDALIQRVFDPSLNDYAYVLLPITRAFVYGEVSRDKGAADPAPCDAKRANFFMPTAQCNR